MVSNGQNVISLLSVGNLVGRGVIHGDEHCRYAEDFVALSTATVVLSGVSFGSAV